MIDAEANGITDGMALHVDWIMSRYEATPFETSVMQLNCGCVITQSRSRGIVNIDTPREAPDWVNNPAVGDVEKAERWLDDHGF